MIAFIGKTLLFTALGLVVLFGAKALYIKVQQQHRLGLREEVAWVGSMASKGAKQVKELVKDSTASRSQPGTEPAPPPAACQPAPQEPHHAIAASVQAQDEAPMPPQPPPVERRVVEDSISRLMRAQNILMTKVEDTHE